MEKIGYHGRFISRNNKVDTLKVDNIENNMVDRVLDASHLIFSAFKCGQERKKNKHER